MAVSELCAIRHVEWSLVWMEREQRSEPKLVPTYTAIAQTAALDSCYLRFKHTSKYMAHVDDDEFISFSRQVPSTFTTSATNNNILNGTRSSRRLLEHTFATSPKTAPAIYLPPVYVVDCCNNSEYCSTSLNGLPRLRRDPAATHRQLVLPAADYERKLIMKTEAVGAFYVHYITFLMDPDTKTDNTRWRMDDAIVANSSDATVFHFKMPPSLHRDPFGTLNFQNKSIGFDQQFRICELVSPELSYSNYENNMVDAQSYAGIPLQLVRRLERCMKRRMKKKMES